MRQKPTGKDFDAVTLEPHIRMAEAAMIFGLSYKKFHDRFFQKLNKQIRACMVGNKRYLSLIDTVAAAYPGAEKHTLYMMAARYNDKFYYRRSETRKKARGGKLEEI